MKPLEGKTVLAIDDAQPILSFLRISMEMLGAHFQGASTAREGLALFHAIAPDLVVLDLGLPDADGLDLITDFTEGKKSPKNKPHIVILSVRKERHVIERALALGAEHYFVKPFMIDELLETLVKCASHEDQTT